MRIATAGGTGTLGRRHMVTELRGCGHEVRLRAAERGAGVGHHLGVSDIGCDRVPMGYLRAKAEQGPVRWSVVRATRFHELPLPLPRPRLRTVAAVEVARTVADVVERAEPARGGQPFAAWLTERRR